MPSEMGAPPHADDVPDPQRLDEPVADLLELDEEVLLARLGAVHLGETLGVRPADFGRFLRVGRVWLDANVDSLRHTVCEHKKVITLRGSLASDAATEVATIVDILLSVLGQVPATIVAVIIVKRGLHRFCGPLGPVPQTAP